MADRLLITTWHEIIFVEFVRYEQTSHIPERHLFVASGRRRTVPPISGTTLSTLIMWTSSSSQTPCPSRRKRRWGKLLYSSKTFFRLAKIMQLFANKKPNWECNFSMIMRPHFLWSIGLSVFSLSVWRNFPRRQGVTIPSLLILSVITRRLRCWTLFCPTGPGWSSSAAPSPSPLSLCSAVLSDATGTTYAGSILLHFAWQRCFTQRVVT